MYCRSALLAAMPEGGVEIIYSARWPNSDGADLAPVYRQRGSIGRTTQVWYSPEALSMKSLKPLSVVTCNGNTHLVHGGYSKSTEIWWSYRSNGAWVTDAKVANQWSDSGAGLGCLRNTYPLMVHDESGSGTRMLQSVYAP